MEESACKQREKQGLISKTYDQLIISTTKHSNPVEKRAEYLNRHFSKENIQMANSHLKRGPTVTNY